MLCDHCHQREAVIHLKEIIDGEMHELNLCAQCAADVGKVAAHLEDVDLSKLPHEIAAVIALEAAKKAAQLALGGENADEATENEDTEDDELAESARNGAPKLRCPVCGLTAAAFRKTGRMGCAHCYEAFASIIMPALKNMHRGVTHCGTAPDDGGTAASIDKAAALRGRLRALEEELRRAVASEAYEEAARLRDLIRQTEEAAVTPADAETTSNDANTG